MSRAALASALSAVWLSAAIASAQPATAAQATPAPQTAPAEVTPSSTSSHAKKETPAPFYRKYLVPGNTLDDQIIEQEKRIAETPNDANLHNDFGNLLAKRKFPKEAAEQYEIAAGLDKSNFISYYNLGLVREAQGKVGDAISAYQKSIKRKPGFPPSRFRLGLLYEREGKADDAIAQYTQAFLTDPSMRDPRRNPLVISSELIYRASLSNYRQDVAMAVEADAVYAEESRFKTVPVDRTVAAEEVEPTEPAGAAPRDVGPGTTEGGHARRSHATSPGDGSMVGGPQQHTPPPRTNRMNRPAPAPRPTPAPEIVPEPEPEAPQPEPGQDPNAPETVPEPPPQDVEPS